MSTTLVNYVNVTLRFSYIAYLVIHGTFFCFGWAVFLIDFLPFPILPFLLYFIHQQVCVFYYHLLEQQGTFLFAQEDDKTSRYWLIHRVVWVSHGVIIVCIKNGYTKQFLYVVYDGITAENRHDFVIFLRNSHSK